MFTHLSKIGCILLFLAWPHVVRAAPAINEIMWMGTDQGTSDEWVEILNPDEEATDLSGWSLTSLNSKGEEAVIVKFATGTMLDAGEYLVIANAKASASRLAEEPAIVTSSMSLPNTKLLLRLRTAAGELIDIADDGVGAPFAGGNPSGGVKASMERIDPTLSGQESASWATAVASLGFDEGAKTLGTPGFPNSTAADHSPCSDPLALAIYVQDGALRAVGRTTVNFQAIAVSGSIEHVVCSWTFSDGYTSASCNPPAHLFDEPGDFIVRLEAVNQCGNTLVQEEHVIVDPDPASIVPPSPTSSSGPAYDGSKIVLTSALPNPESADTNHEWFELRNLEDHPVDVAAWKIGVGETSVKRYSLKGKLEPKQRLKFYNSELKFTLSNTDSKLWLFDPLGNERSSVDWPKAEEGRIYYSDDLKNLDIIPGMVLNIMDGATVLVSVAGQVSELLDEEFLTVKLFGVVAPDPLKMLDVSYRSSEFLRTLVEDKKIELEFDTMMWDKDGILLAYLTTENSLLAQRELISMGLVSVDDSVDHDRLEEFQALEAAAKQKGIGIWGPSMISQVDGALEKEQKSSVSSSKPAKKKSVKKPKKPAPKKVSAAVKKIQGFAALYRADVEKENEQISFENSQQQTSSAFGIILVGFLSFLVGTGVSIMLHKILVKHSL